MQQSPLSLSPAILRTGRPESLGEKHISLAGVARRSRCRDTITIRPAQFRDSLSEPVFRKRADAARRSRSGAAVSANHAAEVVGGKAELVAGDGAAGRATR